MKRAKTYLLLLAGIVLLAGCQKTGLFSRTGGEFRFSAAARPETKTVYGNYNTAGNHQDILWVNSDQIRIYSPTAARRVAVEQGETNTANLYHWADYQVVPDAEDPTRATIKNLSNDGTGDYYDQDFVDGLDVPYEVGNGLAWKRGEENVDHTFYAVYPMSRPDCNIPDDEGKGVTPSSTTNALKGVNGVFPFHISNTQDFSEKGNMQYAYMTATGHGTASDAIFLDFYPEYTAFEIMVKSAGDPIGLSKFELISDKEVLFGDYVTDYSTGTKRYTSFPTDYSNPTPETAANRAISVNLNGHSAGSDYLTFTVFALPHEYTNLSVRFTTTQGTVRTLKLKYSATASGEGITPGANMSFAPCVKHRIYGLALPNGELLISVGTDPWKEGGNSTYTTIEDASTIFDYQQTRLFLNGQPLWTDTHIAIAPGYEVIHYDPTDDTKTTNRPMYSPMFTLTTVSVGVELKLISDNANVGFVSFEDGIYTEPAAFLTIPESVVTEAKPYGTENVTTYYVVPLDGASAGTQAKISLIRTDTNTPIAYTHQYLPGTTDHTKVKFMVVSTTDYTDNTISVEETL